MNNNNYIHVVILSIAFVISMFVMPNIRTIAIVNLISMLFLNYIIYKKQGTLFTPLLLILASLYVFHAGHLWVALFKGNAETFLLNLGYAGSSLDLITLFRKLTILLILFGCTGACFVKRSINIKDRAFFIPGTWFRSFVVILYIIMMFFEISRAGNVSAKGYGEGYQYSNTFALMLSDWINILLITMMYAYKDNPKLFWRYTGMLMFRALFIMFFVGNRGSSVIQIITAVFIISRFSYLSNNKAKLKGLIGSIGAFLLVALPLISIMRQGVASGEAFSDQGPIESFLMEFGDTARNTFLVDGFIRQMGDMKGLQILATSLTIVPMSTIFFGDLITHYGMVGLFLNEFFNIRGLGGSMFGQLYFNFGDSAFLYLSTVAIALFSTWISNNLMTKDNSIYKTLIFVGLFVGLMTNVRGEWYSTMSSLKISLYLCLYLYFFNRNRIGYRK